MFLRQGCGLLPPRELCSRVLPSIYSNSQYPQRLPLQPGVWVARQKYRVCRETRQKQRIDYENHASPYSQHVLNGQRPPYAQHAKTRSHQACHVSLPRIQAPWDKGVCSPPRSPPRAGRAAQRARSDYNSCGENIGRKKSEPACLDHWVSIELNGESTFNAAVRSARLKTFRQLHE